MKSFYEMLNILEGLERGGLGHELNCVDWMQLSSGHWAGHNFAGKVFVSTASYPRGEQPERFKFEEGRPAEEEEEKEYWALHRRNTRVNDSPIWAYDDEQ